MTEHRRRPNTLLDHGPADSFGLILGAWRLWLLGAALGALLGWAAYTISPPDFRARATVVVDHNLEAAWQYFPDRQLFQFLERETERLEELAWSDVVLRAVANAASAGPVQDLRAGRLQLAQPGDGVWSFYAYAGDAADAKVLASAWAEAFVEAAHDAVEADPELQAARSALDAELVLGEDADPERVEQLTDEIAALAEHTRGVSPYLEIALSQAAEPPVERSRSLGEYLLVASLLGGLTAAAVVVLRGERPTA